MKQRAFSLIEVIVAFVIMSILAIGFLVAMGSNYNMLNIAKKHSQAIYHAQGDIFDNYDTIRKIKEGEPGYDDFKRIDFHEPFDIYFRWDYPIKLYQYEGVVDGRRVVAFACHPYAHTPDKPDTGKVSLKTYRYYNPITLPYLSRSNLKIKAKKSGGNGEIYHYKWYVADNDATGKPFNLSIDQNGLINAEDLGLRYPVFPHDYRHLAAYDDDKVVNLDSSFAGKHVIVTAQAFDFKKPGGELIRGAGDIVLSNSIYLPALLEIDDICTHFDMSVIDYYNEDYVAQDGTKELLNWINLAETHEDAKTIAIANNRPVLRQLSLSEQVKAQYARFTSATELALPSDSGDTYTLFFVTRGAEGKQLTENCTDNVVATSAGDSGVIKLTSAMVTADGESITVKAECDFFEILMYHANLAEDEKNSIEAYLKHKYSIH